ncbi:MAG TPA: SAM-dependent chlorinase/fluorinase [Nitriliruptorales bacterium]|nr:SAM-dependent chlorinase/fluorinase [Nitriliruptorales bacterium]
MSHPGPPATYATIVLLTDFGRSDTFVGVCHVVLARTAPHARVIDLTHDVAPGDVRLGALLLSRAARYAPVAVHLAVVDPGVGTDRRGLAIAAARGDVLVGPDNGLLPPTAEALGGVVGAWELADERFRLQPASATFHGRDVFAPAAGALASGVDPAELGPTVTDLVRTPLHAPARVAEGALTAEVVVVDRFGNVQLGAAPADLAALGAGPGARVSVTVGGTVRHARYVHTFAEGESGTLLLHVDSDGALALAVNRGSAAEVLGADRGALATVRPVPSGTGPLQQRQR